MQVSPEAAVGFPIIVIEAAPFVMTELPILAVTAYEEVADDDTIANVNVAPPLLELGVIEGTSVELSEKSDIRPVVAPVADDTLMEHVKLTPAR